LESYNWSEAMRALHRFSWSEFCDWYIELAKLQLDGERALATRAVLAHVLDSVLRLLHPVMPFITEDLWSRLHPGRDSIMVAPWPASSGRSDPAARDALDRFRDLVAALRRLKVDYGIPPGKRIAVQVNAGGFEPEVRSLAPAAVALARLESLDLVDGLPPAAGHARTLTPAGIEAWVALDAVVDVESERRRVRSGIARAEADIQRSERKLADAKFLEKAPTPVVDKERAKLAEAQLARRKLEEQVAALGGTQ
jgi:valyl-tRNA synthetase